MKNKKALWLLRLGLGLFFVLWGIDKIVAPGSTVKIFEMFYMMPISVSLAPMIGAIEIIFGLAFIAGVYKDRVYLLGVLLHGISTLASYRQYMDPFGKNHLFLAAIPLLFAYVALYMMRDEDTYRCYK